MRPLFLFSLHLIPALNIFRVHSERRIKLRFDVLFHDSTPLRSGGRVDGRTPLPHGAQYSANSVAATRARRLDRRSAAASLSTWATASLHADVVQPIQQGGYLD